MAATSIHPFIASGDTVSNQFSASNETLALTVPTYAPGGFSVRVYNSGSDTLFIKFGVSTVEAATATGMPIPGSTVETFSVPESTTHVAGITASGTPTVYFTSGFSA